MWIVAIGCFSLYTCLILRFFQKYQTRLKEEEAGLVRVEDYQGVPIPVMFDYKGELDGVLDRAQVDVNEIYHYGGDYFLRGFDIRDNQCRIYRWTAVHNPKDPATGRCIRSLYELLPSS